MKDFSIKLLILSLTFLFIFNHSSIAYAGSNYNDFKTTQNNEIIRVNFEKPILYEKNLYLYLNDSSKVVESTSNPTNEFISQIFFGYLAYFGLEIIIFPFLTTALISFHILEGSDSIIIYFLFLLIFIDSISVFISGKNKEKHSYLITMLGSTIGMLTYYLLAAAFVVSKSYLDIINDDNEINGFYQKSFIINVQDIGVLFIAPLLATIGGVIFYHISKKEEKSTLSEPTKASMRPEELISKIKTQKGSFSFKIADF